VDPAAEPVVEGTAETPAFIAVKVDPKHPSSQGQTEVRVADELSARVVRAYENQNAKQLQMDVEKRQADLAELNAELTTARQELAVMHDKDDRTEADKAAWTKWEASDDYKTKADRFRQLQELEVDGTVPKGTASEYWRGAALGYQDTAKAEYQTRANARAAERGERETQQWIAQAEKNQSYLSEAVRTHPEYPTWFNKAVKSFDSELRLGHITDVQPGNPASMHKAFTDFFRGVLIRHEAVRNVMQSSITQKKQEEAAVADKAAAQGRRDAEIGRRAVETKMAELASRRSDVPPPNPIGNLSSAARDGVPVVPVSDGPDPSTMGPRDREKARIERVKLRARNRRAG